MSKFSTAAFGNTDPEDVAYDPASGHLFVCDGSGIEIYDVNPVNGMFGDGNDVVTHFDVARYGLPATARAWESTRTATRCWPSIGRPTRSTSSARAALCCGP